MTFHIVKESNGKNKKYIDEELYLFNLKHLPEDIAGRYEELNLFLKDDEENVRGGILCEVCWNWLEIKSFMLDEDIRKSGYGTTLLLEVEKAALEKDCDYIKVDTFSFQALDFYKKKGYEVFGTIDGAGREFKHYYLKKELKKG